MKNFCLVIMAGLLVVSGFACATATARSSVQVNHPYASYSVSGAGTNEETINALGKYGVFKSRTGIIIERMGKQIEATPGVRFDLGPDHLIIEGGQPAELKLKAVLKNGSQTNILVVEFYRADNATETLLGQAALAPNSARTFEGLLPGAYLVKGKFVNGQKTIKDFQYNFVLSENMSLTFNEKVR